MPIHEATLASKKKRLIWIAIRWRWQHHNSGGKVFVQVRDVLEAGTIEPRRVKLPGILVDGIVEHREQPQTYLGGYDLTISGQHRRLSSNDAIELVSHPVRRLIAVGQRGNW